MDGEKLKQQIGSNIAAYRKRAGLTQAGLAEKLNYSDKAVSKWERGESMPDVTTLVQLAEQFDITVNDLIGHPLFCSQQSWENDIRPWAKERFSQLHLEGSFRLSYNGSMFAKEGLGILLTLNNLIDTSKESGLIFRPLSPHLEMKMYLIWNKYQSFTPVAERFLKQVKSSFTGNA